jgi:hypothetical protein
MPRLDYAFIANHAQPTPDGLLSILGAGVDSLWAPALPAAFKGVLIVRLAANVAEATRSHELEIQVNDEDGHPILNMPIRLQIQFQIPPQLPVGWEVGAFSIGDFSGMPLSREGRYSFELLVNAQWLRSLPFRVVIGPPQFAPIRQTNVQVPPDLGPQVPPGQ